MNSTELIAAVRNDSFIGDANTFPDFTDARLLGELNDALQGIFPEIVVKARAGYWLKQLTMQTSVGRAKYRMPARACNGALEKLEMEYDGAFCAISEVPEARAQEYESFGSVNAGTGYPSAQHFCLRGDVITLLPAATSVTRLRLTYYIRPSRLQAQQSSGTIRGRIDGVNPTTRELVVNAIPFDQTTGAAIVSGTSTIDVVKPTGWHELSLVGQPQTYLGTTILVGGTYPLDEIEVGDFVRAEEQTDWPCLPDEYHRALAGVAAVRVLLELSQPSKAGTLAASAKGDLDRFRTLLEPRVKSQPKLMRAQLISQLGCGYGPRWGR